MKLISFFTFFLLFLSVLVGQDNAKIAYSDFEARYQVYDTTLSTKGIELRWNYFFDSEKLLPFYVKPLKVSIIKNGGIVYKDSLQIATFSKGEKQQLTSFIPYRSIDLPKGEHRDVSLIIAVEGLFSLEEKMTFVQEQRIQISLELQEAQVKKNLLPWDKGNSVNAWAPDVFYELSTNEKEGKGAFFKSIIHPNSFDIPAADVDFYLLEGEKVFWRFYDEDGQEDQLLAEKSFIADSIYFAKAYKGLMVDNLKKFSFRHKQKKETRQAINIYVQKLADYKGKSGVELRVHYDLPKAYLGEEFKAQFAFMDKIGGSIDVPLIYEMNAEGDGTFQIIKMDSLRGDRRYFIPFYAWDQKINSLSFTLADDKGRKVFAAPVFVVEPLSIAPFLKYISLEIDEGQKVMGLTGELLKLNYALEEVHKYADLQLYFKSHSKIPTRAYVYQKNREWLYVEDSLFLQQGTYRGEDSCWLFIPHYTLARDSLSFKVALQTDISLNMLEQVWDYSDLDQECSDADVQIRKNKKGIRSGDYGYKITLQYKLPEGLVGKGRIEGYTLQNQDTCFLIGGKEELTKAVDELELFLPLRTIVGKDSVVISFKIKDDKGQDLSKKVTSTLPATDSSDIKRISFSLKKYNLERKHKNAHNLQLCIYIGSSLRIAKSLVKSQVKSTFTQLPLSMHKKDYITVYVKEKGKKGKGQLLYRSNYQGVKEKKSYKKLKKVKFFKKIKIKIN